eukprot:184267-Chlamydomonas_euryale.AAC.3
MWKLAGQTAYHHSSIRCLQRCESAGQTAHCHCQRRSNCSNVARSQPAQQPAGSAARLVTRPAAVCGTAGAAACWQRGAFRHAP